MVDQSVRVNMGIQDMSTHSKLSYFPTSSFIRERVNRHSNSGGHVASTSDRSTMAGAPPRSTLFTTAYPEKDQEPTGNGKRKPDGTVATGSNSSSGVCRQDTENEGGDRYISL